MGMRRHLLAFQALSRQVQGSLAIRISSSRQLQMVRQARQARQVGRPRVSPPGRQAGGRARGIRLFPSRRSPNLQRIICRPCEFLITSLGALVRLTPKDPI